MSDNKLEVLNKIGRDIIKSSVLLNEKQARFLVDSYYTMQADRIRTANQVRSMEEEPHEVLKWAFDQFSLLENEIKKALDIYSNSNYIGRWMRSIIGIGPVIAAGFLAHLDITKAETAGAFWRFAGLDPTMKWEKGKKRPFNAQLKTLCWKLGESFVKFQNNENDVYGKLYSMRKKSEIAKNEMGAFKEEAEEKLKKFKIGKSTDAYKCYIQGKLPPAHLHARARRFAVKMFLSHLHEIWFKHHFKVDPPAPFVFSLAEHTHYISPPILIE